MSDSPSNSRSDDTRLDELIADYMQRIDRGEAVDREQFLAEHPDFAAELRAFFETDEQVERLASPALDSRPATLDSSPTDRDAATLPPSSMVSGAPERSDATPLDYSPLTTHHSLATIRYFGDYELLEEIARGGMGVVYKARQVSLNRIVAVKMILAGQLAGPDDVRRFRTEAEAAAQLQHPNIVAIHEVGEHEGQQYFSMDYVEGTSLAALVRENPLPAKQAAAIVQTVAEAIHYAHQKGILHRDLKPSNILLQEDQTENAKSQCREDAKKESEASSSEEQSNPSEKTTSPLRAFAPLRLCVSSHQIKVTDFGLAKRIEGGSELTGTGQILGTPSYMPPEQAGAKRGEIGPASDVYSLGAILYELLTGRPPFRAETPLDTLLQVLDSEPVAPRLLNPKLPRDLETICLKCLSKPPAQRYGTAADLAEDLRRYLSGEPIHARPVTSAERLWSLCRRNRVVAGLAAAVVVALVAGSIISTYFALEARAQARESSWHLYAAHMNLVQAAWENARVPRVLDLLKRHEARPGNEDLRGFEWHYWNRLAHSYQMSLEGHSGSVRSVAFSSDGKRLATASADRTVKVWDATTGQEMLTLRGHTGSVSSVAFSADGTRLASASADKTVRVWDAANGRETLTLKGHTLAVSAVAFSADGKRLASASEDKTVKLWDSTSDQEPLTLNGHNDVVLRVAFSTDGTRLASASHDMTVRVWDTTSGQETHTLSGHTGWVKGVAFSPDGKRLASASDDQMVKVWDATTGQAMLTLKGHVNAVWSVAFSADGKRLASASSDRTVKVWDATSGEETLTLKGHTGGVMCVAFSSDGRRLASASDDQTAKVWDATGGQEALTLTGHTSMVLNEASSEDGIQRSRRAVLEHTRLFFAGVSSVAFSPDGKRLASATRDPISIGTQDNVKVWDATTGQEMFTLKGHLAPVTSVAFSADGKRLASVSADSTVKLWDAVNGKELLTLNGHASFVWSVAFSPVGNRLASGSHDRTVKIWDATTGQESLTLEGHSGPVASVAFSADGQRLASASVDQTVKVWNATSGQELFTLEGHIGPVTSVAFSADGKRLASASRYRVDLESPGLVNRPGEVKLWDATSGQGLLTLKGHTDKVMCVAFSPDGKRLASASYDQTVKVWDVASGQETLTLKGHTNVVWSVAFSADGNRLASASYDGTVKVWDATPWTPELRAEQEALSLVRFYSTPPIAKDELLARIRADATVSEPVRERALEFARQWPEGKP